MKQAMIPHTLESGILHPTGLAIQHQWMKKILKQGQSRKKRGGYRDYWMASDVLEATSHGYDGYVFDKNGKKQEFIGYRADAINNYAIHYLQEYKKENPFFLFISQIEPITRMTIIALKGRMEVRKSLKTLFLHRI